MSLKKDPKLRSNINLLGVVLSDTGEDLSMTQWMTEGEPCTGVAPVPPAQCPELLTITAAEHPEWAGLGAWVQYCEEPGSVDFWLKVILESVED